MGVELEALLVRAKVALDLVQAGELDGEVALSLVISPGDELAAGSTGSGRASREAPRA
jgi:hypothetical protein